MKFTIFTIALIVFTVSSGFSLSDDLGNPRKGKYLYRKNCLSCHKYGTKNQLGPNSKTMEEWKAAFQHYKIDSYSCKSHWEKLSDDDLLDIFTHMYSHASDSPQPASCK
jgi:cytochrome c2